MDHVTQHGNVIMTLSGHVQLKLDTRSQQSGKWCMGVKHRSLMYRGYIRLFDVYQDRIEVYTYSAWENKSYIGTLDRFTIRLNAADKMKTETYGAMKRYHANTSIRSERDNLLSGIETMIIMYWQRKRRAEKTTDRARG